MFPRKPFTLFVVIVALVILVSSLYIHYIPANTQPQKPMPTISINYSNLPEQLSKNAIIHALPADGVLVLRFYNFKSGQRQWENSYLLKQGRVSLLSGNLPPADMTLSLSSTYLTGLTNKNFCDVIKKANKNGDLGIETSSSQLSLGWKFKSLYAYRDCLGF